MICKPKPGFALPSSTNAAPRQMACATSGGSTKIGEMRILLLCVIALAAACGEDENCVDGNCQCPVSESCNFDCEEGGCSQQCDDNSTCSADCAGGGCLQQCDDLATCVFTCSGGGCTQQCGGNPDCSTSCSGTCTTM